MTSGSRAKAGLWIAVLIFTLLLSSCAKSYVQPGYSVPGFSFEDLKGAKTLLIVRDAVEVRQFAKAFKGAFGSADSFSFRLARMTADSLNHGTPAFSFTTDRSDSVGVRYILRVENIVIDSAMKYVAAVSTPSGVSEQPGGVGTLEKTGGGFEVRCLVSYDVTVLDSGGIAKKASFSVRGASTVFLSHQAALENAVWSGTVHLIEYLRTGRTKF